MKSNQPLRDIHCVACGNEAVQKVSSVVNSSTWGANTSGSYSGNSVGMVGRKVTYSSHQGKTSTNSSGTTYLAQILAPPERPVIKYENPPIILLVIISFLSGILLLTYGGVSVIFGGFVLVFTAFISVITFSAVRDAKTQYEAKCSFANKQWEKAMTRWNNLYYCPRCDNVYHPQTNQYAPPEQMNTLL